MIPFNKPYLAGKEAHYIYQAVYDGKISGNGQFTRRCHRFFEDRFGFHRCFLTTSCTDALEMAAILLEIQPGDEVILPSFTFVSTANAFVLRGAKMVFVDSQTIHPNMDVDQIASLITPRTKAIVPVHYAGIACKMDRIMQLAREHDLYVVEDAAHAIDSYYNEKPLASIGHLATLSFHESKNVISGEGGMLVVNDERFAERAEIIWEKGTNRVSFFRGEIEKYNWVDIGSSFLPSEVIAAFLYAQLENMNQIQQKRRLLSGIYGERLQSLAAEHHIQISMIPDYASNNGHMFYLVCRNPEERTRLRQTLEKRGVNAVFHYMSLHNSPYYTDKHDGRVLKQSDRYADCLLRLPLFYELQPEQVEYICDCVLAFYAGVDV